MPEINLTQDEAEALIAMEKHRVSDDVHEFPSLGDAISIPLISTDHRENFILDINRGRIDIAKITYQNRARKVVVLVRLDISGRPHINPDGEELPCPHLHIYREGFGDKWATALPKDKFTDTTEPIRFLEDFMGYCNITEPPIIQRGVF